jgi:hypothetical protein
LWNAKPISVFKPAITAPQMTYINTSPSSTAVPIARAPCTVLWQNSNDSSLRRCLDLARAAVIAQRPSTPIGILIRQKGRHGIAWRFVFSTMSKPLEYVCVRCYSHRISSSWLGCCRRGGNLPSKATTKPGSAMRILGSFSTVLM